MLAIGFRGRPEGTGACLITEVPEVAGHSSTNSGVAKEASDAVDLAGAVMQITGKEPLKRKLPPLSKVNIAEKFSNRLRSRLPAWRLIGHVTSITVISEGLQLMFTSSLAKTQVDNAFSSQSQSSSYSSIQRQHISSQLNEMLDIGVLIELSSSSLFYSHNRVFVCSRNTDPLK